VSARDSEDVASYDEEVAKATVGDPAHNTRKVEIHDYDPEWPRLYEREAERIREALGGRVLRLEHVGSTSVPGLPAKPVIDMVLEVPDSSAEETYVPDLERAGYRLQIREPEWFEHRLFKGPDTNVNLHAFSRGEAEIDAMIRFRDHLRRQPGERELYAATKRELAAREWTYVQQYADAKTAVVREILARAEERAASPE
jgi:GrpB-like predicted nucleotidyltransferase (UPF0157 family)